MKHFTDQKFEDKPWLIVGKGPSLSKWNDIFHNNYNTFVLNQAVFITKKATVLHAVDYEIFEIIRDYPKEFMCCPSYFNENQKPSDKFIGDIDIKNILSYDHYMKNVKETIFFKDKKPITAYYNSGENAFGLLHQLGQKTIYTIGIDGGSEREKTFPEYRTELRHNPRYDQQIKTINKFCQEKQIKWVKL